MPARENLRDLWQDGLGNRNIDPGVVSISLASSTALSGGSGSIAIIQLHVKPGVEPRDTLISPASAKLSGQYGDDLAWKALVVSTFAGTFKILGDYDGDGLLDQWETMDLDPNTPGIQSPFDPYNPDVMGDNFDPHPDGIPDGQNDWDGDGMSNADEFTFGFNPTDETSFGEMPLCAWPLAIVLLALGVRAARRRLRV